jgi:hypothetical protein
MVMRSEDVVATLQAACRKAGSQAAWARAHKIPDSIVAETIRGRRDPGPAVLRALGLRKILTYVSDPGAQTREPDNAAGRCGIERGK